MADDMGWSDTSNPRTNQGHPSDYYETPTIDRLSAEGMSFTNAYTSGPSCAPTRAALLTGQYAPRPTNNVYAVGNLDKFPGAMLVGVSQGLQSGTDAIPTGAFTYAEMLQQAGYRTAHFGKFHMTEMGAAGAALIVSDHGFDENYGGTQLGNPGAYHAVGAQFGSEIGPELDAYAANYTPEYIDANVKPFSSGVSEGALGSLAGAPKHVSDAMTDAALEYMDRVVGDHDDRPFLLQFHPYAVHTPIGDRHARPDLLQKYRNKPRGRQDKNAPFGALLEGVDQNVARLIKFLETTPDPRNPGKRLYENTIVFLYSDNGGRQPQSNNGPLRGEKGVLYEGGIRVPLIAWSGNPDLVDGGAINETPIASIDFYKTFAALARTDVPAGLTLDGVDLSPILADRNATLDRDALFWHYPGNNRHGTLQPRSVVRIGNWKLLYSYEDQTFELYDLGKDISETTNLVGQRPEKALELARRLMLWLDSVDAPLATLRKDRIVVAADGPVYCDGQISSHHGPLTIRAGDEVPFMLGGSTSPPRIGLRPVATKINGP